MSDSAKLEVLQAGHVLDGCYTTIRQISLGGFGVTYLASMKRDGVKQQFVVKEHFPRWGATRAPGSAQIESLPGEESRYKWSLRLFKEEAEKLSLLKNPNIVQVVRNFEQNGTAYYVMPLIDGGSLEYGISWLRSNRLHLSQGALLSLLRQLLSALLHMHSTPFKDSAFGGMRPIYHLDIKPSNILFDDTPAEKRPVLIDFGDPDMGSYGYSPWELRSPGEIGPWTDLYSLAASFHELITYMAPPPHLDRQGNVILPPPARKPLASNPSFCSLYDPRILETIDKALSWHPRDRFSSAGEWLAALVGIPLRWPDNGVELIQFVTKPPKATLWERISPVLTKYSQVLVFVFVLVSVLTCYFCYNSFRQEDSAPASDAPAYSGASYARESSAPTEAPSVSLAEEAGEPSPAPLPEEAALPPQDGRQNPESPSDSGAAAEGQTPAGNEPEAQAAPVEATVPELAPPPAAHTCPSVKEILGYRKGSPNHTKLKQQAENGCETCKGLLAYVHSCSEELSAEDRKKFADAGCDTCKGKITELPAPAPAAHTCPRVQDVMGYRKGGAKHQKLKQNADAGCKTCRSLLEYVHICGDPNMTQAKRAKFADAGCTSCARILTQKTKPAPGKRPSNTSQQDKQKSKPKKNVKVSEEEQKKQIMKAAEELFSSKRDKKSGKSYQGIRKAADEAFY